MLSTAPVKIATIGSMARREIESAQAAGPDMPLDDIRQLAAALLWALDNATLAERQEILRSFIVRVSAARYGDELTGEVEYRLPSALGDAGTFTVAIV